MRNHLENFIIYHNAKCKQFEFVISKHSKQGQPVAPPILMKDSPIRGGGRKENVLNQDTLSSSSSTEIDRPFSQV